MSSLPRMDYQPPTPSLRRPDMPPILVLRPDAMPDGSGPAAAAPSAPQSSPTMPAHPTNTLPNASRTINMHGNIRDTLFPLIPDGYGHVPSILWFLSTLGPSSVYIGACLINWYTSSVLAYAVVQDFITRDLTHALFRVRIKGWMTASGLRIPGTDFFSFLVVPIASVHEYFQGLMGAFLSTPFQGRLADQVHRIATHTRQAITRNDPTGLVRGCPATIAFLVTHLICPPLRQFSTGRDSGVVFNVLDMELPLSHNMPKPPSDFDPEAEPVRPTLMSEYRSLTPISADVNCVRTWLCSLRARPSFLPHLVPS